MPCTIIIPTHNRPALLKEAVASALAACPPEGEVLVVDDRSEPPAAGGLAEVTDARLRVIRSDQPPGVSGARNCGIDAARHDVILFLDDDDLMVEDYPARVLAAAGAEPRAGFGIANSQRVDLATGATEREALPLPRGVIPPGTPLRRVLVSAGRGFWARREVLRHAGMFEPGQILEEDTSLAIRLRLAGVQGHFEPEPGSVTRLNATEGSAQAEQITRSQASRQYESYLATYAAYAGKFGPYSEERWFLLTRFLRRAAKAGRSRDAAGVVLRHRPRPMALAALVYLGAKSLKHRRAS